MLLGGNFLGLNHRQRYAYKAGNNPWHILQTIKEVEKFNGYKSEQDQSNKTRFKDFRQNKLSPPILKKKKQRLCVTI